MKDSVVLVEIIKCFINTEVMSQIFLHVSLAFLLLLFCQTELLHSLALLEDIELSEEVGKKHSLEPRRVLILKDTINQLTNLLVPIFHLHLHQGKHQFL